MPFEALYNCNTENVVSNDYMLNNLNDTNIYSDISIDEDLTVLTKTKLIKRQLLILYQ